MFPEVVLLQEASGGGRTLSLPFLILCRASVILFFVTFGHEKAPSLSLLSCFISSESGLVSVKKKNRAKMVAEH